MEFVKVVKNSFYASGVQVATMLFGLLKTFMIPKMLGVVGFGWWQYYLLWVGYVGLFALGFNDGFYLKYGSYDYGDLPKNRLNSSFIVFVLVEIIISVLFASCILFLPDVEKRLILLAVALNIPLHAIKGFFIYIFQVTNRIKRYSFYSLVDRFSFLLIVALFYIFGITNYWIVIWLDIASLIFVIILMIYTCRDIFKQKYFTWSLGVKEFWDNVSVGVKLMIAIFTASLAGGLAKLFVESNEGIERFSCFAFAMSSTSIVILFINGLATIAYPTLTRLQKERYSYYFTQLDRLVSVLAFSCLALYPFLLFAIKLWFSEYSRCLEYYPLIIAGIFITAKMSLVINTFYKALREETAMLIVNVLKCIVLVFMLFSFYYVWKSEISVALAILLSGMAVYYYSKHYLSRKLNCESMKDNVLESGMIVLFILTSNVGNIYGFTIYLISMLLYIMYYYKDISFLIAHLKTSRSI